MLYPYYVMLFGGFGGTYTTNNRKTEHGLMDLGAMYMMGRMVLGHKTWFAKD